MRLELSYASLMLHEENIDDNRRPTASINFVTAHDGFTLNDYHEKLDYKLPEEKYGCHWTKVS
jgi:pullulanase/glycogen debranching enzyme